jgi:hypothetical protein
VVVTPGLTVKLVNATALLALLVYHCGISPAEQLAVKVVFSTPIQILGFVLPAFVGAFGIGFTTMLTLARLAGKVSQPVEFLQLTLYTIGLVPAGLGNTVKFVKATPALVYHCAVSPAPQLALNTTLSPIQIADLLLVAFVGAGGYGNTTTLTFALALGKVSHWVVLSLQPT